MKPYVQFRGEPRHEIVEKIIVPVGILKYKSQGALTPVIPAEIMGRIFGIETGVDNIVPGPQEKGTDKYNDAQP
ncbi:MAG: hypothetical protein SCH71_07210 [Desulfobulbaceae bacterium]|nr:hypothetical protein [Desulfobulbaceae bacterium]